MMKAALYVSGRIVVGDSHLDAYRKLSESEKDGDLVSGFYDGETEEFQSDMEKDHFYDKELFLIRHGRAEDPAAPDPDISDEGICQVQQLASELCGRNFCGVEGITSPLLRCLRTASILQERLGIHFRIVPEVMETPHFLDEYEIFKVRNRSRQFPHFDWPTSKEWHVVHETPPDFLERVKDTLCHLPHKAIVVTHYGYICHMVKLALCDAKAQLVVEQGIPPASLTYINRQDVACLGRTHAQILQDRPQTAHREA